MEELSRQLSAAGLEKERMQQSLAREESLLAQMQVRRSPTTLHGCRLCVCVARVIVCLHGC